MKKMQNNAQQNKSISVNNNVIDFRANMQSVKQIKFEPYTTYFAKNYLTLRPIKKGMFYGYTMCNNLRVPCARGINRVAHRHQAAIQHDRHAPAHYVIINKSHQAETCRRNGKFSCKKPWILLRAGRRVAHAVL